MRLSLIQMRYDITLWICLLVRSRVVCKLLHVLGHTLHVLDLLHLYLSVCNCHKLSVTVVELVGCLSQSMALII